MKIGTPAAYRLFAISNTKRTFEIGESEHTNISEFTNRTVGTELLNSELGVELRSSAQTFGNYRPPQSEFMYFTAEFGRKPSSKSARYK